MGTQPIGDAAIMLLAEEIHTMNIRLPLAKLFLILTAFACLPSRAAPTHPNIVFVFGDQWRAQAIGYAGDPNVKTPNLDRLMTGQRPTTHGLFLNDAHLSDDAVTVAKVLDAAGYDTGYIGKWHINGRGRMSYIPPENRQGFVYWKAMECTHDYNHSFYYADTPQRLEWTGYDAFAQTDDACRYIRTHSKSDKPFALFMSWGPPHNPYPTAPLEFQKMYDASSIQIRPNVPSELAAKTRKELAAYYAHCSALDQCIGQIWQMLKDAGIEENTIVVFTADHGDMLGETMG